MDQQGGNPVQSVQQSANFEATDWKTVIEACDGGSESSFTALERLCSTYRYPLYVYVRKKGFSSHDADDLVQGFFAHLLSTDGLKTVSQSKGKFRNFLIASMENFISKDRERSQAQKRGGGKQTLSFDAMEAEERFSNEPRDNWTPENALNRSWALVMIETVMARLRGELEETVQQARFKELQRYLSCSAGEEDYASSAAKLNTTVGNVRVLVRRLRDRFGELLYGEVARTVADPSEIDAEIEELRQALTHWNMPPMQR